MTQMTMIDAQARLPELLASPRREKPYGLTLLSAGALFDAYGVVAREASAHVKVPQPC